MKFKDLLESRSRSEDLIKISDKGEQIYFHLIKLLYFKRKIDINHHFSDINGWLKEISVIVMRQNFKKEFIKTLLTHKLIITKNGKKFVPYDSTKIINDKLKKYHGLDNMRSQEELKDLLNKVYDTISEILSKKEIISIKDIIEDYILL